MAADAVVTVSQSYAQELLEDPQLYRADLFLAPRKSDLWGIVNGADTIEWNPSTDPHLRPAYGTHDVAEGKAANKRLLLREMRMPSDEGNMPLVAFIGRLDYQKGPDIMLEMLDYLANMDVQVRRLGCRINPGACVLCVCLVMLRRLRKQCVKGWVGDHALQSINHVWVHSCHCRWCCWDLERRTTRQHFSKQNRITPGSPVCTWALTYPLPTASWPQLTSCLCPRGAQRESVHIV